MEIYIVKQGDTLENIASLYNVSVFFLRMRFLPKKATRLV